jgi:hypothetical protein
MKEKTHMVGKTSELVYTIVNPIASLSDLQNRYSPSGFPIRFPSAINKQIQ